MKAPDFLSYPKVIRAQTQKEIIHGITLSKIMTEMIEFCRRLATSYEENISHHDHIAKSSNMQWLFRYHEI